MIDNLKKIKSNIISPWLVCALTIFTFVIISSKELFEDVYGIMLYLYFAALAVFLLDIRNFSTPYIIVFFANILLTLFTILLNIGGVGSVLTYVFSIALVIAIANTKFNKIHLAIIFFACLAVTVMLFVYSFYYVKNKSDILLEDGALNPNTYAQFLAFAFIMACCLINFNIKKQLLYKIILFIVSCIIFVGVVNYKARTSMGALFVFVILNLLPKKFLTKKTLSIIAILLFLFQLVFPFIYLFIFNSGIEFTFFGKNFFTGREILWTNMFKYFQEEPVRIIFGLGSKVSLSSKFMLGPNNNVWAVIANFGLLGFLGYLLFFIFILKNLKFNTDTQQKFFIMYIACVLLCGCTEVVTFWEPTFMLTSIGIAIVCNENFNKKSEFTITI